MGVLQALTQLSRVSLVLVSHGSGQLPDTDSLSPSADVIPLSQAS